jgi:DNA-binding NtrC family response regulator
MADTATDTIHTLDHPEATTLHRLVCTAVYGPEGLLRSSVPVGSRPFTVGREALGELALPADPRMSGAHFALRGAAGGLEAELMDLGSRNGTYVNGALVTRPTLVRPGDVVRAGRTLFVMEDDGFHDASGEKIAGVLVGRSAALRSLRAKIVRLAELGADVHITGPSGAGKEQVARAFVALVPAGAPFQAVNCADYTSEMIRSELFGHERGAFTSADRGRKGAFLAAHGGVLLLDEIGELALDQQPKLLRALDARAVRPVGSDRDVPYRAQVLSATHRDLSQMVATGAFRLDLWMRLRQGVLRVPRLSERRADIVDIAQRVLDGQAPGRRLDPSSMEELLLHPWLGEVRELIALLRLLEREAGPVVKLNDLARDAMAETRAFTGADGASSDSQPRPAQNPEPAPRVPTSWPGADDPLGRKRVLEELLLHYGGNMSAVARHLDCAEGSVFRWCDKYGIPRGFGRPTPPGDRERGK